METRKLERARALVTIGLTVATIAVYYGFIAVVAFAGGVLGTPITERIPVGIPLGISVILISWVFTGIYVRWANVWYDPRARRIREGRPHDRD